MSLGSATTLTGLVASVLLGFLHRQVVSNGMTEAQLAAMLNSGIEATRSVTPVVFGLPLAWFMGTAYTAPTPAVPVREDAAPGGGLLWWQWLLIALGLILLILLLLRACGPDKTTTDQADQPVVVTPTDTLASDLDGNESGSGIPDVKVGVDLPGGRKVNVAERSFNYALIQYLAAKDGQYPRVFAFDNLTFEPGSARITAESRPNVNDLIQIMQAYPSLRIRVEGNTDNTGTDAQNDALSGERAEAVKEALVAGGIEPSRVATRERGDTMLVATNQTATGREQNRRIDVVVLGVTAPPAGPIVRVVVDAPGGRKLLLTDKAFAYQLARYLSTKGSRPNKSFLFDELRFATNTARITPDAQAEVTDLAQIMKTYPALHIRVVGYTDSVGLESVNKPLSAVRASFVKQALVEAGIGANRITTSNEGQDEPIATNQTAKGRQRNRRVEIIITELL
ncbi:OmpA family protein [Spirosoma oryzae]|uniref:OmpA family protein n=1 Tax=Spirosoma oryzae TaxID=1469603 RepID=A0A2T0RXM1_9BACT|nr:OmpA family protein [Spirosoma oryzae]PRY25882.1 OmpA family protein [Spirosoma oryzae]